MIGKRLSLVALAVFIVFAVGCKKKPPTPPAAAVTPPTPVTSPEPKEVAPAPRPATNDVVESDIPSDLAEATEWAHQKGLLGVVYFEFDSSTLSSTAQDRLTRNASFLNEHPEFTVSIEGHCDERGTNEYNIALGDRRAGAAADFVTSQGIPSSRLKTVSYGEERPECRESAESCWSKNRRAYFRLTGRR